jgi:xanthine dehydrogenase YagR molybdenum-binding subunit
MDNIIGQPVDRVDGKLKVAGQAQFAAEFSLKDLAYGVTVQSTIALGKIRRMDTSKAKAAPGVLAVLNWQNAPRFKKLSEKESAAQNIKFGEKYLLPLQSDQIYYDGQHIALVVAKTFEEAEWAASLIEVEYEEHSATISMDNYLTQAYEPKESMGRPLQIKRGDIEQARREAPVQLEHAYSTPVYHHNPMEPHATIAAWAGDHLTLYDSTQSVLGNRNAVAATLGIPPANVRLISLFVGGGFGCKGFTWPHSILAPMAAREVGRPVKIVLTRQQMFTCNGRRARTVQRVSLGAEKSGKLVSTEHESLSDTSFVDEFVETAALPTQSLYDCPNLRVTHKLIRLNRGTPTPTRAPGEATGTFALESALDELSYELDIDPIELRLINYAEIDPQKRKPWSLKNLRECYQRGAAAIGWSKRPRRPRSEREGNCFVGYGMATAIYPANRVPASARVRIYQDGHAVASCCTQDIGTGTYTIMTQIAAEALGLPLERVKFELGDSTLPTGPVSGGSQTAASVGPAVKEAALAARDKLLRAAASQAQSPLFGNGLENIAVENGRCFARNNPAAGETYSEILRRSRMDFAQGEAETRGTTREGGAKKEKPKKTPGKENIDLELDSSPYSFHSFGAQFARVLFDPDLGTVRATHFAAVMDVGRVLNLKTAKNQIMGGMIFGLGMALMEETIYDPWRGRIVTRDLANYLVPVHADIPEIEVQFIDQPDPHISSIGARGVGEIGITGITAAVANAVYHASGKRVRDLPITPDKLL